MSSKKSSKIFEDDDDDGGELKFNTAYAERYNSWRGKEELQKLKDRYGSDVEEAAADEESESATSSDDDDEDNWTPAQEKQFLKTLSKLKSKNPTIYDKNEIFFEKSAESSKSSKMNSNAKPFLLKDHERKMILENQGLEPKLVKDKASKSYHEELEEIKNQFSVAIDGDDDDGDLLKVRVKTTQETEEEDEYYRKWLKGQVEKLEQFNSGTSKKDEEELKFLRDYWTDPKLDEGEQFLRDYILNRKYVEENEDSTKIPTYDEIVHDSDEEGLSGDERKLKQMEQFENKYNFRFEEPDQEFIKKYPRTIEETYRRKESKRKEEREKVRNRKQLEKEKKLGEIQQLKALKRKEIMDKLNKIQEITGVEALPFDDNDLEGDFDPEEYDRKMRKLFNEEEYYKNQEADVERKPIFPYDEDIDGDVEDLEYWVPSAEEDDDNGEEQASNSKSKTKKDKNVEPTSSKNVASSLRCYEEELLESQQSRASKKKRKSLFLQKLEKEKPHFDPQSHKSFQKYFDEYYKLDFEDLIGDIPCRFKYRNVVPNDFGLTTEEILAAPDLELNQWASLKKTFQYRPAEEEKYEVQAYAKKAADIKSKKKKIPSLFAPRNEEDEDFSENVGNAATQVNGDKSVEGLKKKKKKKKRKKKISNDECEPAGESLQSAVEEIKNSDIEKKSMRQRKRSRKIANGESAQESIQPTLGQTNHKPTQQRKRNKKIANGESTQESIQPTAGQTNNNPIQQRKRSQNQGKTTSAIVVDSDRLKAYGINPTKYKKRRKYGV